MRLMRGADGTYSYQYVADANAIAEAEQEVASIENALINLDEEAFKDQLDTFYDDIEEFMDKVKKLAEDGFTEEEIGFITARFLDLKSSAGEAGDLLEYLKSSSGMSDESIFNMLALSPDYIKALGGLEGANAQDIINDILTAWGGTIDEVSGENLGDGFMGMLKSYGYMTKNLGDTAKLENIANTYH
jgi:hypothetical protein